MKHAAAAWIRIGNCECRLWQSEPVLEERYMVRLLFTAFAIATGALSIFVVRTPRGIDFILRNSPTNSKYLIETMGGGVALLDYNNDGKLDIFLVNGGALATAMAPDAGFRRDAPAYWNRL